MIQSAFHEAMMITVRGICRMDGLIFCPKECGNWYQDRRMT